MTTKTTNIMIKKRTMAMPNPATLLLKRAWRALRYRRGAAVRSSQRRGQIRLLREFVFRGNDRIKNLRRGHPRKRDKLSWETVPWSLNKPPTLILGEISRMLSRIPMDRR